jgi:hypothetical protein
VRCSPELVARLGEDAWVEPPFRCDYGWNISLGEGAYLRDVPPRGGRSRQPLPRPA